MKLRFELLAVVLFAATPLLAASHEQVELAEVPLGCVKIDLEAAGSNSALDQSWQSWCDLREDVEEITCFDQAEDGVFIERVTFKAEYILKRRSAGERTCPPLLSSITKPIIRD